jgi:SAM-dependent methyltransferase
MSGIIAALSRAATDVSLSFPAPAGQGGRAIWTGNGFRVGDDLVRVVKYQVRDSGWTDGLTELHEAEAGSDHYIDIASRNHALARVEKWISRDGVIMDIGCSSGHMLRLLRDRIPNARLIGADYVSGPLERLARELPDIPLVQFDLTACPLDGAIADGIIALNVLEHIADDPLAICQIFRLLKPGGRAIVEVPAGPGLYDIYDRQLLHRRRYRLKTLRSLFGQNGFRILEASHLGFFLYPGFWLVKKWNRRYLAASDDDQRRRVIAKIRMARHSPLMSALMSVESKLGNRFRYPFGIRCLLVAERPR